MPRRTFKAAGLLALAAITLTGCAASTPTPTPTATGATLATVIANTTESITFEGVTATLESQFGGKATTGYWDRENLYLNTFTFQTRDGEQQYHHIGASRTEKSWENLQKFLAAKVGDAIYLGFADGETGEGKVAAIKTDQSGDTYTTVITYDRPGSPYTTVTVDAKNGYVDHAKVEHSWTPDAGLADGCAYYPEIPYCLSHINYTYGDNAQGYFVRALSLYEDQIANPETKGDFLRLLEVLDASAKKASTTGYTTVLGDGSADMYKWSPNGEGRSVTNNYDGTYSTGATSLYDFSGSIFQSIFLDPTDGGAMYTAQDITWDAKANAFKVSITEYESATFTVTDGLLTKVVLKMDGEGAEVWTIQYTYMGDY